MGVTMRALQIGSPPAAPEVAACRFELTVTVPVKEKLAPAWVAVPATIRMGVGSVAALMSPPVSHTWPISAAGSVMPWAFAGNNCNPGLSKSTSSPDRNGCGIGRGVDVPTSQPHLADQCRRLGDAVGLCREQLQSRIEQVDIQSRCLLSNVGAGQVATRRLAAGYWSTFVQVHGADVELGLIEDDVPTCAVGEGQRLSCHRVGWPSPRDLDIHRLATGLRDAPRSCGQGQCEEIRSLHHEPPKLKPRVRNRARGGPAAKVRSGTSVGCGWL